MVIPLSTARPSTWWKCHFVGGVGGLVPVALAGHHHPHGRVGFLHGAGLHGRGVGAKELRTGRPSASLWSIQRVFPHIPGRDGPVGCSASRSCNGPHSTSGPSITWNPIDTKASQISRSIWVRGVETADGRRTARPGDVYLLLLGQDGEAAFSDPPAPRPSNSLFQEGFWP